MSFFSISLLFVFFFVDLNAYRVDFSLQLRSSVRWLMKIAQFARIYEQWTITRTSLFWYSVFIHSLSFFLSVSFSSFYTYKCKCECKGFWRMDLFTHVSSIHTYIVWLPTTRIIFFPSIFSQSPFLALRLRLYSQPCSCSIPYVQPIQTQQHL